MWERKTETVEEDRNGVGSVGPPGSRAGVRWAVDLGQAKAQASCCCSLTQGPRDQRPGRLSLGDRMVIGYSWLRLKQQRNWIKQKKLQLTHACPSTTCRHKIKNSFWRRWDGVKVSILQIISENICQVVHLEFEWARIQPNSWCWLDQLYDRWFIVKSFEVVNFELGQKEKIIWLMFVLTSTWNTHQKKKFKILVILQKTRDVTFIMLYCIPQLHILNTEISHQMSNLKWYLRY
jgi:hypothetical protein